jgi:hypothetical protein
MGRGHQAKGVLGSGKGEEQVRYLVGCALPLAV